MVGGWRRHLLVGVLFHEPNELGAVAVPEESLQFAEQVHGPPGQVGDVGNGTKTLTDYDVRCVR